MRAALATAVSLLLAASVGAQDRSTRAPRPIDVPYVSQSELLCGGAAAAMLMRHAGVRGVYAEDFLPLVDPSRGGIAAADLRRALTARGFDARTSQGTPALAREHVNAGRPVMVLLEAAPGRFHYVVVVGWRDGTVVYHDPARAPFMTSGEPAFDRAWAASGRWMLVARATPAAFGARSAAVPSSETAPAPDGPRGDALRAFEAGDYRRAALLAGRAARVEPSDGAWRLLAASRYLAGDSGAALDAWNRAGEPRIDLVRLDGLVRTPHRTAERLMGLAAGTTLTRGALTRARRRLALLPAREASNISYVALPGGIVEVRGAIVERPTLPSRSEWLVEGARLPIDHEVNIPLANLARAGDRLSAAWRFRAGQRRAAVSYRFPGQDGRGVWTVRGGWQEERYGASAVSSSNRREAAVEWTDWVGSGLRLVAEAGLARWEGQRVSPDSTGERAPARAGGAARPGIAAVIGGGMELRPAGDHTSVLLRGRLAAGETSFATASADARWRLPLGERFRAAGSAGVGHATASAPLDAWFGAGAGHARPLLLRAHPLLDEGEIRGPAFGRTIAQGTVELQREVYSRGVLSIDVAGFTDAARAWRGIDASASPLHVDAGVGLRLRLAPGGDAIRLDWAHGLRDGQTAVSVGWRVWGSD